MTGGPHPILINREAERILILGMALGAFKPMVGTCVQVLGSQALFGEQIAEVFHQ
jgi:hypothetical protein